MPSLSSTLSLNLDPSRLRRIFLRDFALDTSIGVHAHEKEKRQRVLFNVDLYLERYSPQSDSLEEVLDYDFIGRTIEAAIREGHIELQETLCDRVAATLLQHPKALAVRVSTMKPDIYANCAGVGVEVLCIKGQDA